MRSRNLIVSAGLGMILAGSVTQAQEPVAIDPVEVAQAPRPAQVPAPAQVPPRPAATTPAPAQAPTAGPSPAASAAFAAPAPTLFGPSGAGGLLGTSSFSSGSNPQMIGDQAPFMVKQQITLPQPPALPRPTPPGAPPTTPNPSKATAFVPSVRGFKAAENQSPAPQDRVFFTFNYFGDLNGAVNKRFESPVDNLRAYRYIFGFEKTFDEGRGSVGVRLPLNTLTANSSLSGSFNKLGGTSTSLGDLGIFAKYVLKADPKTGSLISAGLQLTLPTGPNQFAGAKYITGLNDTIIEPFVGYLLVRDRFYLQGFTSISTPSSIKDVTMVYNDIGLGYFLVRSTEPTAFFTGVAPTIEAHINTPLTHGGVFNSNDIAGTPAVVDLTYGLNVTMKSNYVMTLGVVTPVTGPRPFNTEYLLLFNVYYGRSRKAIIPPILGG